MSDLSNDNGGSGLQINKFVFWASAGLVVFFVASPC